MPHVPISLHTAKRGTDSLLSPNLEPLGMRLYSIHQMTLNSIPVSRNSLHLEAQNVHQYKNIPSPSSFSILKLRSPPFMHQVQLQITCNCVSIGPPRGPQRHTGAHICTWPCASRPCLHGWSSEGPVTSAHEHGPAVPDEARDAN